ncbi:methylase involved in ubiquinone/menaquinone biosynthesis [Pseudomonas asplenii]|uniref:Methylase involved in ubiquinone/menaquinone biosynthesis n=1 Tax=Pseudomonas asplenii TaxID=53407 RepID=A0A0N0E626_9PSED|nr:class I SAM-dependent methyltransferase [Pseudomonas fuscovaginae]KPA93151.1 methylase involved in ubiquinone/menaquinone biosynthesis [Pseudomonas fuscovaginae]
MSSPVKLEFSDKYDEQHAQEYLHKHQNGLWRRLSHLRDEQLARHALALAGEPGLVLDLPCGAGRFWPLLARKPNRVIIGADNSAPMLETALKAQPANVVSRIRPLQTSAFDIDLPENSVDSIFCMRLLHHIGESAHRLALLKEFYRVTRDSVIVSLWVDGNFKAWRRKRLERRREAAAQPSSYRNRFVLPAAQVEEEFRRVGFRVQQHLDFFPFYAMWRVYILRKR